MNWFSFFKLPSRIATILAGVGVLGGFLAPGSVEAGYRKVPEKYQDVDVKVLQSGPTLLFSDSPEMVYENGILYKDIVEGEGRVFFHHVNGTKNTRKLAILMRPVARKGQTRYFKEYKESWNKVRKKELAEKRDKRTKKAKDEGKLPDYSFYQKLSDLPLTTLAQGEYLEVLSQARNEKQAGARLKPEQLLTGMFDFHVNHPVEIVIMMCDPKEDIENFSQKAAILPMDEHPLRGTYEHADLTYIVKKPLQMKWYQAKALCLADSENGNFLMGTDRTTGRQTQNHGNYGVIYHLLYSVAGEHPVQMGINPWGGEFHGAGMMIADEKAELLNLPGKSLFFGKGDEVDDVFLHSSNHKRKDAEFIWSPPGASNLPIRVFWTVNRLENSRQS